MGDERVTVKNSEIIEIDKENNILLVKGAVPGARNGLVMIMGEGELVINKQESNEVIKQEEIKEEAKEEVKTEEKVEETKSEEAETEEIKN